MEESEPSVEHSVSNVRALVRLAVVLVRSDRSLVVRDGGLQGRRCNLCYLLCDVFVRDALADSYGLVVTKRDSEVCHVYRAALVHVRCGEVWQRLGDDCSFREGLSLAFFFSLALSCFQRSGNGCGLLATEFRGDVAVNNDVLCMAILWQTDFSESRP